MIVEVESAGVHLERDGEPTSVVMRFDPADPYAVTFVLGKPGRPDWPSVSWSFARDLLADGIDRCEDHPAGELDVKVWRGVFLRLSRPEGTATLLLNRFDVLKFLRCSLALVERGKESEHLDLDGAVARLLAGRDG